MAISRRVFWLQKERWTWRRVHDDEQGLQHGCWRVGFCAGNADMIRGLATIKGYYDYGMFQAIQIAAIVALRDTEAAVDVNR